MDLAALQDAMLGVVQSAFVPLKSPDDVAEPMSSRDAARSVFSEFWQLRHSELNKGLESLVFVALASAWTDEAAWQRLHAAVDALGGVLASCVALEEDTAPDAIKFLILARLGEMLSWRANRDSRPAIEACATATLVLVEQLISPHGDASVRPNWNVVSYVGDRSARGDAVMTRSTIVSSALSVLAKATYVDFFRFLAPQRIAERAAVDRKTVVNYFHEPGRPNVFSRLELLTAAERALMVAFKKEADLGRYANDAAARIDLIGAATAREEWQRENRLSCTGFDLASLHALGLELCEPGDTTLSLVQAYAGILVSGHLLFQRLAGKAPDPEVVRGIHEMALHTFARASVDREGS